MKKTVFCNITMKEVPDKLIYPTTDASIPTSERAVVYPINSFLEKTLLPDDEVKVVLLVKMDPDGNYKKNTASFVEELLGVNENIKAKLEIVYINTEFSEEQSIHEALMSKIVDEVEDGAKILCDITYGPKDLPIVLFTALGFCEKFLSCEIDKIIYGQVNFKAGKPENPKICDMSSLYYLSSVTNTINCKDSGKAREILKSLLSL